jgi:6-phosphogluconolactonase
MRNRHLTTLALTGFSITTWFLLPMASARAESKLTVYIGTYTRGWACPPENKGSPAPCTSKGIYRASFDTASGKLGKAELAAESDNPSYVIVHPGGKLAYAVNEVGDYKGEKAGAVSAFAVEPDGKLRLINQLSSHGADPCHLSLTASGKHLLVANYSGGNVSSYKVRDDGGLEDAGTVADAGAHGPHANQDAAHAHFIVEGPLPGVVYAADLGLDKVLVYDLDAASGKLKPHAPGGAVAGGAFATVPAGNGPRHLAIHPGGKFLFSNNELGTSVSVFSRDPATGALAAAPLQTLSTIPLPYGKHSDNAEIQISADGRFLYVSNRGHNSINVFSVDAASGKLKSIQNIPSGGHEPRDFKLDPTGKFLLVGHQNSDDIYVFRVDPRSGKLTRTAGKLTVSKPVSFWFAK